MELEATDSEKKQLSYATQFFGFTPDAFVDSIHVPSIEIVNEHLEAAKERIASEFTGKVNKTELEESFNNIKSTYTSNTEEVLNKFGRYLKKNIFDIPLNIVLPEDRPHIEPESKNYNGQKIQEDLAQTKNLRQEILNARYRKAILKTKLANLHIVAQRQQDLVKQAELFRSEKEAWEDLWETQVQRFHEKMSTLKPVMDKIENNIPEPELKNLKRKLDVEDICVAKKMKLDKENKESN